MSVEAAQIGGIARSLMKNARHISVVACQAVSVKPMAATHSPAPVKPHTPTRLRPQRRLPSRRTSQSDNPPPISAPKAPQANGRPVRISESANEIWWTSSKYNGCQVGKKYQAKLTQAAT